MARRQKIDQAVVGDTDRAIGFDAAFAVGVVEQFETVEQAPAEPDAMFTHLQVAAQDARQNNHRRLLGCRKAIDRRQRNAPNPITR